MKNILKGLLITIAVVILSPTASAEAVLYLPIVEVYDGDTIKTDINLLLPIPLNKMSIRINGIDTPEMPARSYAVTGKLSRAKCIKEAELAIVAKAMVQSIVDASDEKYMRVTNYSWGKYGGRMLGDVSIDGVNIGPMLINAGLAVEYHGVGKKNDWCAP